MEIIKKYKSGKTRLQHDDIVIFVKPYSGGMIVRSNSRKLSEAEVKEAYEIATGKVADFCVIDCGNWEVRENV